MRARGEAVTSLKAEACTLYRRIIMNVLAIGNSFSHDATRYLHGIARAAGEALNVVNLYIGGCSLERHYRNMLSEERVYELEINGERSGFNVSLREALLNRAWDVVTMQQVSSQSNRYESYQPYLNALSAYVRELCPKAKQVIHQTWAYEAQSQKLTEQMGYATPKQMTDDVACAYRKAAEAIGADTTIRSGELMQMLCENGIGRMHRDGYHADKGLARYAIALLWYGTLTGNGVENNGFSDFDEPVGEQERAVVAHCVSAFLKK